MKFRGRKLGAALLALGLMVTSLGAMVPSVEGKAATNSQTVSAKMPFHVLTGAEMVAEMGTGWNLGNTMDGHTGFTPSETIWQNVETTQELVKTIHDLGFNTIRIPVTWGTMIDDAQDYAIDETWMSRVQDIVDYAVNMNMYAIINIHHDGAEQTGWLRVGAEDLDPVKEKFAAVWGHIAERFKDYDEHVIFESMNEVTGPGSELAKDTAVINELNQIFVDTVRATGSNNAERWLSVPGRYTNIPNTTNPDLGFALPEDTVENRLFVAVHYYDWTFGLLENMSTTTFGPQTAAAVLYDFQKLANCFTSKGIPVILGEYGAINKNNTPDRTYHMEIVNRICQLVGVVPCYWDQGWYDLSMEPDYSFTLVDRDTCEVLYPEIIAGIMRGIFLEGEEDLSDITMNVETNAITDLGSAEGTLYLEMGEVEYLSLAEVVDKAQFNDVVLWKSADESVATVNPYLEDLSVWGANVHATGIGNTVITAYTTSGVTLDIPVEVKAEKTSTPCTEIVVQQESYTVTSGQSFYLNASMAPADTDAYLTYRSTNPEVITVSRIGKVVAKSSGTAYVVITSSDGKTKSIPVVVEEGEATAQISLALNVYFNDSTLNYFSNEIGTAISVTEDGTYTLSFDCAKDLSSAAVAAGVTGLSNLTAIYIKDDTVSKGLAKKSPLVSCDIIYDEILVDGKVLEVQMDAPKSALKASGIFDTNDPINSWDGSVVEEVTVANHVLNFTDIENPQKVEVTFTLSNLVFEEGAAEIAEKPVLTSLTKVGDENLTVEEGKPLTVTVKASPVNAGKIFAVAENGSLVAVNNTAVPIGEDGTLSFQLYAHGTGNTLVTLIGENGLQLQYEVAVTGGSNSAPLTLLGQEEQSGQEAPESPAESVPEESTQESGAEVPAPSQSSSNTLQMILLILGILVLGGVVFVITLKVAGGKQK